MTKRGRVKWFNNQAGWGFIERADEADVYVRYEKISGEGFRSLHTGDLVEFSLRKGPQGPYATDVVVISQNDTTSQQAC